MSKGVGSHSNENQKKQQQRRLPTTWFKVSTGVSANAVELWDRTCPPSCGHSSPMQRQCPDILEKHLLVAGGPKGRGGADPGNKESQGE